MNLAPTVFTSDLDALVFVRDTKLFRAMRALRIKIVLFDQIAFNVQQKRAITEFALQRLTHIFAIDSQFTMASRAVDKIASRLCLCHRLDFFEWYELWNLDTVALEVGIQQRATCLAVNQILRHVFATNRAWSARPSRHNDSCPLSNSI